MLIFQGGDPLILSSQISRFIESAKQIMSQMSRRSFISFRSEILPVIEQLRSERGKEFSKNMFSKHTWWGILHSHSELEIKWNSLPRTKIPQGSPSEATESWPQEECTYPCPVGMEMSLMNDSPSTNFTNTFSPGREEDGTGSVEPIFFDENNDQQPQMETDDLNQGQNNEEFDDQYSIYNIKVGAFEEFAKIIGLDESEPPQEPTKNAEKEIPLFELPNDEIMELLVENRFNSLQPSNCFFSDC